MAKEKYDVVIIGAGPGGYAAALTATKLGGRVAIVEAAELGGTCVNRGCIPSMVWLKAAGVLIQVSRGEAFGITAKVERVHAATIVERAAEVATAIGDGMEAVMDSRSIEIVRGSASLISATQVVVGDRTLAANAVILATGSSVAPASVEGLAAAAMTTDELLAAESVPESLLVLGGGHREVEMAGLLQAFGTTVVMATGPGGVLPGEEDEVSQRVLKSLVDRGIRVFVGCELTGVTAAGGQFAAELSGPKAETVTIGRVLLCARRPNSAGLGLDALGVELDADGAVVVDDRLQTSVAGIYAIGDLTGGRMLSHTATAMGKVAAANAMGQEQEFDGRLVPRGMWGIPQMGAVGLTEEEADDLDLDVEVGEFSLAMSGLAMAENEIEGTVKIVKDSEYGEILGVHAIGPRAAELIGEAVLAMEMECTVEEWSKGVRLHPTYSETLVDAARTLIG